MASCAKCHQEVGFLGMLTFNRQTGRCSKCENEIRQALMRFQSAFLSFCSDGRLTPEKWARLSAGANHDQLDIREALMFIRNDVLNLLHRILTFAANDGAISEDEERNICYIGKTLAIPDDLMQPILRQLTRLHLPYSYSPRACIPLTFFYIIAMEK